MRPQICSFSSAKSSSAKRRRKLGLLRSLWFAPLMVLSATSSQNAARAQAPEAGEGVTVTYPLPGNTLSGASKVMFRGVPDNGYVSIYVDMTPTNKVQSFREATTKTSYELNSGALSDGAHTLTFISYSASGRQLGSTSVNFNVRNTGTAGVSEDSVRLVNWTARDSINSKVNRYRIFAFSDATITGDTAAQGGSGGLSGGNSSGFPGAAGGAVIKTQVITPAPLDHQIDMLIRSTVRDIGLIDGAANIRMIVQNSFDRKRIGASSSTGTGGAGDGSASTGGASGGKIAGLPDDYVGKAPWDGKWNRAAETGQAYTKMIKADGEEINATRKPATLPLGDILPTFPTYSVQKGATWNSNILLVGELTKRDPISLVGVPVSLTGFENISTPIGIERRCARIEVAQFSLPDDIAKKIAQALQTEAGSNGAGGGAGALGGSMMGAPMGAGAMGAASGTDAATAPEVKNYRSSFARVLWFDVAAHQMIRSEDTVNSYYEEEPSAQAAGGVGGGSPGGFPGAMGGVGGFQNGFNPGGSPGASGPNFGQPVAPPQPKTVTYNMKIIKFLDDRLPNPTGRWTGGQGTAHSRDSTIKPSLQRANGDVSNYR